jgi:hypothetical protein
MTGSCWRLLAAFSLIFVASCLHGQGAPAERSPSLAPVLAPDLAGLPYSPPIAPLGIPRSATPPPRQPVGGYPEPPGTIVFDQMVRAAGIIFSGQVTSIVRLPSSSEQDPASTTVTFQVEYALRGTATGQNLTIHEWAGLWPRGERYRVGERVLLFLYPPGKLGLTSPVAGPMGRFGMDFQGRVLMGVQHIQTLAADPILGGKTAVPFTDFALAVRRSSREE